MPSVRTALLLLEVVVCLAFIAWEPTYSFDFDAYAEEVAGVTEHGQFDYAQLRGDTGPLVYPAGFVFVYAWLTWFVGWDSKLMTTEYVPKQLPGYEERTLRPAGKILTLQLLFLALYVATLWIVLQLYSLAGVGPALESSDAGSGSSSGSRASPIRLRGLARRNSRDGGAAPGLADADADDDEQPLLSAARSRGQESSGGSSAFRRAVRWLRAHWPLLALCCSRRLHSVFVLGFYNDCVSSALAYASVLAMCHDEWRLAAVVFSCAVSVKMSVLLFAPGLLFLLLRRFGREGAAHHVGLAAAVQLVLGAPFLFTNARAYLTRAFDFGRTFASEHSVTWRFLPEAWLASPLWALLLLAAQLCALALCATRLWPQLALVLQLRQPAIASARSGGLQAERHPLHPRGIVLVMFSSNLVGVVCARSLHYQFLAWYFHSLPLLLQACAPVLPLLLRIGLLVGVELCWNVHPPSAESSACLQLLHCVLLGALAACWGRDPITRHPRARVSAASRGAGGSHERRPSSAFSSGGHASV